MSFIRIKKSGQSKYAYEVTTYWDKESKVSRQKVKYLGRVDDDGNVSRVEQLQLDYGDTYLIKEFISKSIVSPILQNLADSFPEIMPLICYCLCQQSAMYNASTWYEGNAVNMLYPAKMSSQNISRILASMGNENIQRQFFKQYTSLLNSDGGVIIDATSLPNASSIGFNAWGYNDSGISKQLRLLFAVDDRTKLPIFFRYLPGNLLDISTLKSTVLELKQLGVPFRFALIDAGYMSSENVQTLYKNQIDFLTRLPSNRKLYKALINQHVQDLETAKYAVKYGNRGLFVKQIPVEFEEQQAYAYVVLDPVRKGKELNSVITITEDISDSALYNCGTMILVSSISIGAKNVVEHYYSRQAVEQIFGFCKSDLQILPLRRHNDATIRGLLLLQFITLIIFIQMREALAGKYTVEQALMCARNVKCKIYGQKMIIAEFNKKQKEIYKLCNVCHCITCSS